MAQVTITGNVGSVDLRFTQNNKAVCTVSVAENHRKKDQSGQFIDDGTTWRNVTFWERMAEAVADSVQQGQRVIVTGDERLREFQAKDGSTGKSLEINGRDIGVLVMPKRDDQPNATGGQSGGWPQPAPAGDAWGGGGWDTGQAPGF